MSLFQICPRCGVQIDSKYKTCPNCGLQLKKPFYSNVAFWVISIVLLIIAIVMTIIFILSRNNNTDIFQEAEDISGITFNPSLSSAIENNNDSTDNQDSDGAPDTTDAETESTTIALDSEFAENISHDTELERAIIQIVEENGAVLTSLSTEPGSTGGDVVWVEILVENNEAVARAISDQIAAQPGLPSLVSIIFEDIELGYFTGTIFTTYIYGDGTTIFEAENGESQNDTPEDTERIDWINMQFSSETGANLVLEQLIISNVENSDTYEHVETEFYDVNSETVLETVNTFFESFGTDKRAKIGDLFIQSAFAIEDSDGELIITYAYGLAEYPEDTMTLIGIE